MPKTKLNVNFLQTWMTGAKYNDISPEIGEKLGRHQSKNWGKTMLSAQKLSENCCPEIENEIAQVLAETVPGLK